MYIAYHMKQGNEYATLTSSVREGKKVRKGDSINLGRVLDKKRGIYRSRERGVFTYNADTGEYGPAPADFLEPPKRRRGKYIKEGKKKRSLLMMRFGDVFFYQKFIEQIGITEVIDSIDYANKDTLHALLCYYVTSSASNSEAELWHSLSYARVLYPDARLSSQRISDALAEIGLEENRRKFYHAFINFTLNFKMTDTKPDFGMLPEEATGNGVLMDSTGLPNASKMAVTAVNNHNGVISNEVRVIYVVNQSNGLPILMRYVAGNVVDSSTIIRTIQELKQFGVDVNYSLLDAGYYNGKNADVLYEANISFVSRAHSNNKIFKEAVKNHILELDGPDNLVRYHGGLYFILKVDLMIGSKGSHKAYGYLCRDLTTWSCDMRNVTANAEDIDEDPNETFVHMQESGLFMLVSSRDISKKSILSLYYTRNQVEEIFRIGKSTGKMLPVSKREEETLRGHLLITLLSSTILKILQDRLLGTNFTPEKVFRTLAYQGALIYPDCLSTTEPVKEMNDIYKHFKIECPVSLPYTPTEEEMARM